MPHIVIPEQHFLHDVQHELTRARTKFDWWPSNPVEAAAIMAEESGEVVKAVNNYYHGHGDDTPADIYTEIVQTVAMAIRVATETPLFEEYWKERQ